MPDTALADDLGAGPAGPGAPGPLPGGALSEESASISAADIQVCEAEREGKKTTHREPSVADCVEAARGCGRRASRLGLKTPPS